jgi:hypothetical protein
MRMFSKWRILDELQDEITELELQKRRLEVENSQLRNSTIRFSIQTGMGIKPIYQATLEYAILATILAGGNGLHPDLDGPMVEVISEWRPEISEREDYFDG